MSEDEDKGVLEEVAGEVIVRNAEQLEMMATLQNLKAECDDVLRRASAEAEENESLYRLNADWESAHCDIAERFLTDDGTMGWRCWVSPADDSRLAAYVADQLRNRGWEGAEVVTQW